MSDFSVFRVPERQLSGITQSLAPVEDTSKGVGMSALAQGISDISKMGGQAYRQYEQDLRQEQQDARQANRDAIAAAKYEADQLNLKFSQDYSEVLTVAAEGVSSGQWTKEQASTYIRDKRKGLKSQGAVMTELDKQESGFHKTLLGKPLAEKSLEEKAKEELVKAYTADLAYYDPTADGETEEINFKRWVQKQKDDAVFKDKMDLLDLQLKQKNLSNDKRKELEEEKRLAAEEKLAEGAKDLPNRFSTRLKNLVQEADSMYNTGQVDEAGKVVYIQQGVKAIATEFKTGVAQARTVSGLTELADVSNDMIDNFAELATENASKTSLLQALDNEAELLLATTGNAILASSPNLQAVGGANKYLQGVVGLEVQQSGIKEINKFVQNLTNGLPNDFSVPAGDKVKAQSVKDYFKLISNNIDLIGKTDRTGKVKVRKMDVVDQISDVVKFLDRADADGERLASTMAVVEQLAYGQAGKFLKENATFFEPEVQLSAKNSIANYTNKVSGWANAELKDLLPEAVIKAKAEKATNPRNRVAALRKTSYDDLELVVLNGIVQFVGKTPRSRDLAEEANKKVSKHLTTTVKASANITGESMDRTLENQKSIVWPAKYGVQEGEAEEVFQTPEGEVATPVKEGAVYMSEDGELFKIVNGERQVL